MSNYLGFEPTAEAEYYFVSYNNEDAGRVSVLVGAMNRAGIPLWYDYGIAAGEEWRVMINLRIARSQALFLFLTKGVFLKEHSYVQREYNIAREAGRRIIVLLMEEITRNDVPDSKLDWWVEIKEKQCIPVYTLGSSEERIRAVQRELGTGSLPADAAEEKKPAAPAETAPDSGKEEESYLFVSAPYKDWDQVGPILEGMRERGIRVWYNEPGAHDPGKEGREAARIRNCDGVVAFLSFNFLQSANCRDELAYARNLDKDVLCIMLEPLRWSAVEHLVPEGTRNINWYYYRRQEEQFYSELAETDLVRRNMG